MLPPKDLTSVRLLRLTFAECIALRTSASFSDGMAAEAASRSFRSGERRQLRISESTSRRACVKSM